VRIREGGAILSRLCTRPPRGKRKKVLGTWEHSRRVWGISRLSAPPETDEWGGKLEKNFLIP